MCKATNLMGEVNTTGILAIKNSKILSVKNISITSDSCDHFVSFSFISTNQTY